jgi:hypothetical protein
MDRNQRKIWEKVSVSASRYVHGLNEYVDAMILSQGGEEKVSESLWKDMIVALPSPVIYVVLQLLIRLSLYVALEEEAFDKDTVAKYPRAKTDLDYTLKQIWKGWRTKVERASENSVVLDSNPYTLLFNFLEKWVEVISTQSFNSPYQIQRTTFEEVDSQL